ncbi:efflux RND transporter periplasmic adaptor subunit [Altererythrobacter sp. RZ02]|uniref:Efflux RND transporter periplasmic adaptor subunit n=1 Tax=Pontixanthobacter rizhaonensis TaxID=2730337 RepID=A0A848QJ28_9SPHN|nr:efflux RND transporter periplasmic adaptor subunit [Pontixanthobacter rizhaonensis]NMW30617.1 efflux RND transporter periplasmic adaptor subunit [Pontixanthobacter rizhaonensis]
MTEDTSQQSVEEFLGEKERPRWRRWAKYWVPALILIVLVLAISRCSGGDDGPEYITQDVTEKSLDLTVSATGNLRPTNQVEVGSEISGRIDDIRADVNDRVTRGQILAVVNTEIIDDQIAQARANLNAAKAQVAQAAAGLNVNQAQLNRFREVYRLSDGKVPSRVELEQAEASVARDKAAVAAARANVRAAEATLSSNNVQRSRAVIRSPVSGVVLARRVEPGQTVAAAFNTPTLFILAEDLSVMQLRVAIDEADVGQIAPGQKASFTVDAYPGQRFPARVDRIDLASNTTSAEGGSAAAVANSVVSYEARLSVANGDGLLRPGMTATATVATESTGVQMLVPNGALRFKPDDEDEGGGGGPLNVQVGLERGEQQASIGAGSRQTVYILKDDGTTEPIQVTTGQSDGRLTVVKSADLKKGMAVITGVKAAGE